jgi:hypothetical protein
MKERLKKKWDRLKEEPEDVLIVVSAFCLGVAVKVLLNSLPSDDDYGVDVRRGTWDNGTEMIAIRYKNGNIKTFDKNPE